MKYLWWIILASGLIWLRSSVSKFSSGNFVENLGGTLTKFASKNPYPFYKNFLENVAVLNSQIFGLLTLWGEFLIAISLVGGAIILLINPGKLKTVKVPLMVGLLGGAFLNLIFWLASGWTSPSTDSLNLLMLVVQVIAFIALKNA
ncbi:hypothetical protein HY385_01280 [Candidatus Daviesbacteria bacterium]|nr:hypothetical protein [Candidatus Daviesbacteria bacterium]